MRQGAGRLLRTPDDRGVVALLDTRLNHKNWGNAIRRALPDSPRTNRVSDVQRFFSSTSSPEELTDRRGGDAP